jgi:hypothetical protein
MDSRVGSAWGPALARSATPYNTVPAISRRLVTTAVGILAAPLAAGAQSAKAPRAGLLGLGSAEGSPPFEGLRQGLRQQGWVDGQSIAFEDRSIVDHYNGCRRTGRGCDSSLGAGYPNPRSSIPGLPYASAFEPKAGAQCVSSARWDLCGGRRATGVPTATVQPAEALRFDPKKLEETHSPNTPTMCTEALNVDARWLAASGGRSSRLQRNRGSGFWRKSHFLNRSSIPSAHARATA